MIEQLRDKLCAAEHHDNPGTALDQVIGLYLEIASYIKVLEGLQVEAKRIAGDVAGAGDNAVLNGHANLSSSGPWTGR